MKLKFAAIMAFALVGSTSFAQSQTDYAPVRSAVPQVERVATRQRVCENTVVEETTVAPSSHGNAVLGTIVGGVIGSRFGGGSGRLVGTAVGAGIGATVGASNDRPGEIRTDAVPVRSCRDEVTYRDQINGYRVTYEYQGQMYTTVLAHDPGATLKLNVTATPVGD